MGSDARWFDSPQLHKCALSREFAQLRRIPPNVADATMGRDQGVRERMDGGVDPPSVVIGAADPPTGLRSDWVDQQAGRNLDGPCIGRPF
jgi:hypothetical protein